MYLPALSKVGAGGGSEWFDSGFNDVLPRGGIPDHHLFLSFPTFWVLFSCLIIANRGFEWVCFLRWWVIISYCTPLALGFGFAD